MTLEGSQQQAIPWGTGLFSVDPENPPIAAIRELLLAAFTARELLRFCTDRRDFSRLRAHFSPNDGLSDMVDRVLEYCYQYLLWDELLAGVQEHNPRQFARFEPRLCSRQVDRQPEPSAEIGMRDLKPETEVEPAAGLEPIQDRWALLVGVNKYEDAAFQSLKFCVNDVRALGELLERGGYTVNTMYDDAQDKRFEPTLFKVKAELLRLCRTAEPDDLVWVHFSCHGTLDENQDNEPVLILSDSQSLLLKDSALRLKDVEKIMGSSKARRQLLTLDACHVGLDMKRGPDPAFLRYAYDLAEGFALLAGSTSQQQAMEWGELEHGIFTYYLLDGLSGKADRQEQDFVTVGNLVDHTVGGLKKWNFENGGVLQEPTSRTEGVAVQNIKLLEGLRAAAPGPSAGTMQRLAPTKAGDFGEVSSPQTVDQGKIDEETPIDVRLGSLTRAKTGWPARAVEFHRLLGWTQAIRHLCMDRGLTVDLRRGDTLERLNSPFDELAHTVDVRRINSRHKRGRHNLPSVGLFVWRLKVYSVTQTPAYPLEAIGPHWYTFSVLGNNTTLYTRSEPESDPTQIVGEPNLPMPIRRRAFEQVAGPDGVARTQASDDYYGEGKSLAIWAPNWPEKGAPQPIPPERVIPANLNGWQYLPPRGYVAVDPELGRIAFSPHDIPWRGVQVTYHYGFGADIGGGEYERPVSLVAANKVVRVGLNQEFKRIDEALEEISKLLEEWHSDEPVTAIVEICDSRVYMGPVCIELGKNQTLHIRAANRTRPIIRQLDYYDPSLPDAFTVTGQAGSRFSLDGVLIAGGPVCINGPLQEVSFQHMTLVPGWRLLPDCEPVRGLEPSLILYNTPGTRISVDHTILGSIQFDLHEAEGDSVVIHIRDSIVDATGTHGDTLECAAIGTPNWHPAHAVLTVERTTVFGDIYTRAIELAENSIFMGRVWVDRRQQGRMHFCYVTPDSRTPWRDNCQPDLVEQPIRLQFARRVITEGERDRVLTREQQRVRPQFKSTRYSTPTYAQLADTCAEEIRRGADGESEMGAFHLLRQQQRADSLQTLLEEHMPDGRDVGIIYAS